MKYMKPYTKDFFEIHEKVYESMKYARYITHRICKKHITAVFMCEKGSTLDSPFALQSEYFAWHVTSDMSCYMLHVMLDISCFMLLVMLKKSFQIPLHAYFIWHITYTRGVFRTTNDVDISTWHSQMPPNFQLAIQVVSKLEAIRDMEFQYGIYT